jgi:precorrin-6B methylase 2
MLDFHRSLLADEARMAPLRAAIARVVRPGDVVVDLGCGTGILAFFACDAGARRVYAIDRDHIADAASFLTRHLHYADRITVIHDLSTDVSLPERADVLVAELIGAAGLDENLLGFVLDARQRFLRDGAAIIPRAIALHAAPVELPETHQRSVGFWSSGSTGYDLSPLRVFASNTILLLDIAEERHVAAGAELAHVDLTTFTSTLVDGRGDFTASRDGVVHGFALWFHATLAGDIAITNRAKQTDSWTQAFLPLDEPVPVSAGTHIALDLQTDDGKSWRWRGTIGTTAFDQMTMLNRPPCLRP